jgi:glucose/arabinose dehydrogenase
MISLISRVSSARSARPFVRSTLTRVTSSLALAAALAALVATTAIAQPIPQTMTMRNFFKVGTDSLTFNRPVLVKPYPAEDSAFIVLQQNGRIITVRWNGSAWRKTDSASVTVNSGTSGIDERGLLGFAFHPNYMQNGKYYVYYVGGTGSAHLNIVAERTAGPTFRPLTADAQRTIFRITDPYDNHNAGTMGFDGEGHLVFAIGDGGTTQGDPQNRAQNPDSLHGKFLRIDVNSDAYPSDTARNYAIPATNPYKDSASVRPEIWARGLRNPWKWSFHPVTGDIWVGDVGQDNWEEISRVPKGANLGWRQREAASCFNPSSNCLSTGLQAPALSIASPTNTSITGGVFFIGNPSSAYHGTYIFGDYGSHIIRAARVRNDSLVDTTRIGSVNKVVSFDRDRQGRVLATSISPTTGFNISSNVGQVMLLESPDMVLGPVNLRAANKALQKPLALATVLANPDRYEILQLDGTKVRGLPTGVFLVREKAASGAARLMTAVHE